MRAVPASPDATRPLLPFARSSEGPVRALVASAAREGEGTLRFRYLLDADLSALRVPPARQARQADELWKYTCFEAFIASRGDEYFELNFSPSTEWAAYSFTSYRKGMAPLALPSPPRIDVTRSAAQLVVEARIDTRGFLADTTHRIALSAVIEDDSGRITYWALKHAPDKPDFHHVAGFILEV
jgi:hypothetical protein